MTKALVKAAKKVAQFHEVTGLFRCLLESEVSKASAELTWTGPKFDPLMWAQVCAFLRWAKKEHHQEAQVRLYVDSAAGQWCAWAYPQEGSYASTKELEDNAKFKEQRAQFGDNWRPFGTVHSHPDSAFQSSTDEHNEFDQDGIHLTVGNLDKDQFDLHARFYLAHNEITPDMSWFIESGNIIEEVPEWARKFIPDDINDRVARHLLCVPPPKDQEFPEAWKQNVAVKDRGVTVYGGSGGMGMGGVYTRSETVGGVSYVRSLDTKMDLRRMMDAVTDLATETWQQGDSDDDLITKAGKINFEELIAWVEEMIEAIDSVPGVEKFAMLLWRNDCTPEGFIKFLREEMATIQPKDGRTILSLESDPTSWDGYAQ